MNNKITVALLVLICAARVTAPEPVKLSEPPIEPRYLIPINPHGREYEAAIEKLLDKRWGGGTMIYVGGAEGDFVVSVWGKDDGKQDHKQTLHNFITFIEVSPSNAGAVSKKQLETAIHVEFAIAVQRAWAAMLLKTRYPTNRYLGGDGWQTEFSVWVQGAGGVYGQLWSPSEGLPKELMDLGFALAD